MKKWVIYENYAEKIKNNKYNKRQKKNIMKKTNLIYNLCMMIEQFI